jgi:hypothetical protein
MPVFVGLWQVCVGDGTLMRYVQRMTGYVSVLALPHLRSLGFRVSQAETDPREPYSAIGHVPAVGAVVEAIWSSAVVGSDWLRNLESLSSWNAALRGRKSNNKLD